MQELGALSYFWTKNVGDLDKLIVARGFKKLPRVQWIAQSGHTASMAPSIIKHSNACFKFVR